MFELAVDLVELLVDVVGVGGGSALVLVLEVVLE